MNYELHYAGLLFHQTSDADGHEAMKAALTANGYEFTERIHDP